MPIDGQGGFTGILLESFAELENEPFLVQASQMEFDNGKKNQKGATTNGFGVFI